MPVDVNNIQRATQAAFWRICIYLDIIRNCSFHRRHFDTLVGQPLVLALHAFLADWHSNLCYCRWISTKPIEATLSKDNRSPLSFFEHHFRSGIGSSWHLGLSYGIICLGSCWGLMLIMFGIGIGSIVWMASLTGMMVVEKTYPGGQLLVICWG